VYNTGLLIAEGKTLKHLKKKHIIKSHNMINFFCGKGLRSRRYGRTAALRLVVQPYDEDEDDDDYYFCPFPNNRTPLE
jgi:hypothetical protein